MHAPSRSQVKKAGSTLRKHLRGEINDSYSWNESLLIVEAWRRSHAAPLVTANNGLRSRSRTTGVDAQVTQRLKRRQTILDKLTREPTLDLSRMQDIGGCRAVLDSLAALRLLEDRIVNQLSPITHTDYIRRPRRSGYRGVHLVVVYGHRAIEIQLRTRAMHAWAIAAEQYSTTIGMNLKQDGDNPVQEFLKTASVVMTHQELGQSVPIKVVARYDAARVEAVKYLEEVQREQPGFGQDPALHPGIRPA